MQYTNGRAVNLVPRPVAKTKIVTPLSARQMRPLALVYIPEVFGCGLC